MNTSPLISVVIPTYNEERYIEDLLRSIKAQTYENYEIIVGDYKSTDKTLKIARKYGAKIVKTKRIGIAAGKNAALKAAKGEIIAFIDADYILSKRLFQSVVYTFLRQKNADLAAIEPSVRVNKKDLNKRQRIKFSVLSRFINVYKKISYFFVFPAAYACVFCRADLVKEIGNFNEALQVNEDKDFFGRLKKLGKFKMINATAQMSFRRHAKEGLIRTWFGYFRSGILFYVTGKVKAVPRAIRGKIAHRRR